MQTPSVGRRSNESNYNISKAVLIICRTAGSRLQHWAVLNCSAAGLACSSLHCGSRQQAASRQPGSSQQALARKNFFYQIYYFFLDFLLTENVFSQLWTTRNSLSDPRSSAVFVWLTFKSAENGSDLKNVKRRENAADSAAGGGPWFSDNNSGHCRASPSIGQPAFSASNQKSEANESDLKNVRRGKNEARERRAAAQSLIHLRHNAPLFQT